MDYKPTGSTVSDTSFTVVSPIEAVALNVVESVEKVNISSTDLDIQMTKNET